MDLNTLLWQKSLGCTIFKGLWEMINFSFMRIWQLERGSSYMVSDMFAAAVRRHAWTCRGELQGVYMSADEEMGLCVANLGADPPEEPGRWSWACVGPCRPTEVQHLRL